MRKINFLFTLLLCFSLFSCEYVKPNYVGVQMTDYGKNGKSDFSLQKGKVWTAGAGTELFQVPLFEQRADFGDRVLHLKSADNTEFTAKPIYSYTIIEERAVDVVFNNKQLGSGETFMKSLEDNILETKMYDILKEESRRFPTDTLMANSGSLKFEDRSQALLEKEFLSKGLELKTFSCQLDFSDKVKNKIDQRNEVNTNVSVLDQQILEQRKKNELEELRTQQQLIISRGITKEILSQQWIEAWKATGGKVPSVINDKDSPFILNLQK